MRDWNRGRLEALGVRLFDADPQGDSSLGEEEYALLLAHLAGSADARERAAIPCLLALHGGEQAARATEAAMASLPLETAQVLAMLYHVARCLVRSRAPDLRFLLNRQPELWPLADEPKDVPDPVVMEGEMGLAVASDLAKERGAPDLAGDAADLFDTWLRILHLEHEPA